MAKKLIPYINRFTGEVKIVTKQSAKQLSEDWSKPRITKNEKGESVFRFEIDGGQGVVATVDIQESGDQEVEVDGNGNAKNLHS